MKPKPSLEVAFGLSPHHEDAEEEHEEPGEDSGLDQACNEFVDALGLELDEAKRKEVCEALEAFVDLCITQRGKGEPAEEEEPEG